MRLPRRGFLTTCIAAVLAALGIWRRQRPEELPSVCACYACHRNRLRRAGKLPPSVPSNTLEFITPPRGTRLMFWNAPGGPVRHIGECRCLWVESRSSFCQNQPGRKPLTMADWDEVTAERLNTSKLYPLPE